MNMIRRLALAVLLLMAQVVAQSLPRDGRPLGTALGMPSRGKAMISIEEGGLVKVTQWRGTSRGRVVFQTGAQVVGGYDAIGATELDGIVVAGRSGTAGIVEHWVLSQGAWAKSSEFMLPAADFAGVAFDGQSGQLYLLDCVNNAVFKASWQPSMSLQLVALSVLCTQLDLPLLSDSKNLFLEIANPSEVPGISVGQPMLVDLQSGANFRGGVLIRDVAQQVTFDGCILNRYGASMAAVVDEASAASGDSFVAVFASKGVPFDVVDDTGAILGSGVGATDGGPVSVTLSQPLVFGHRYGARVQGATWVSTFTCVHRHGFPEPFSHGVSMSRIAISPGSYYSGNQDFSVSSSLRRIGTNWDGHDYFGAMTLGLETTPIVPFDNGNGLNSILAADYWVGALGFIRDGERSGFVRMKFPIPGSPSVEGLTLLGQFIVFEETGFRLSEIIGFKIQPAQQ